MNVNQILAEKPKKVTSEELLKQVKVTQSDDKPITNVEKALLTNMLCKYKSLKVRMNNTEKAGWSTERKFNEVVLPYFDQVEELLEDFTKQGK